MPVELNASNANNSDGARLVKSYLDNFRKAYKIMEGMRQHLKEPVMTGKLGEISKGIYARGQVVASGDYLAQLPEELRCHIWSFLNNPADRLMFALSSKYNATTFEGLKALKQPAPPVQPAKRRGRTSEAATPSCHQDTGKQVVRSKPKKPDPSELLAILVRLEPWMPKEYRICYVCLRFRRKDVKSQDRSQLGYWMKGKAVETFIGRKSKKELEKVQSLGPRCPDCTQRKRLENQRGTQEWQELREGVKRVFGRNL